LLETGRHRRLCDAKGLRGAPEVTLLGQREQKFKLVDQEDPHDFRVTNTTVPPCEAAKSLGQLGFAVLAAHFNFISLDIISLLIAFPYRHMGRLY